MSLEEEGNQGGQNLVSGKGVHEIGDAAAGCRALWGFIPSVMGNQ